MKLDEDNIKTTFIDSYRGYDLKPLVFHLKSMNAMYSMIYEIQNYFSKTGED